jgi:hypothetical protein
MPGGFMMSRHDWAVLAVIGMSAFVSGSLTFLANKKLAEPRHLPAPAPTVVEVGVELDREGNFFFAPLRPTVRRRFEISPKGEIVFPPLRLKTGEGALTPPGRRDRTPSAFRRVVPLRFNQDEGSVYMFVPWSEEVVLRGQVRHRRHR